MLDTLKAYGANALDYLSARLVERSTISSLTALAVAAGMAEAKVAAITALVPLIAGLVVIALHPDKTIGGE